MGSKEKSRLHDQSDVIAFLSSPISYSPPPTTVERIDTHAAIVFLAGDRAYKIKRAVVLPYLDFSTLPKRRAVLENEYAINRKFAPELYLEVQKIGVDPDGRLEFGGAGPAVEWVLIMRRFDQSALLDHLASRGVLELTLMPELADKIAVMHAASQPVASVCPVEGFNGIIKQIETLVTSRECPIEKSEMLALAKRLASILTHVQARLIARADAGNVRRCHGDLHLGNIVLFDGAPTAFDAIEFDDRIATIDVLYDLCFLLMDLWRRGLRTHANTVLNRYIMHAPQHLDGLGLLPFFMACRAGVRMMVAIHRAENAPTEQREAARNEAIQFFSHARRLAVPDAPRLIAIGGLSGTGKTTVASSLAPDILPAPGAIHLRSDIERKALFNVDPLTRLPDSAYGPEVTAQVYDRLYDKAGRVLESGHAAIVDATFADPRERCRFADLASSLGVSFDGIWLDADRRVLEKRVVDRTGDASDANAAVVRQQAQTDTGAITWHRLEAGRELRAVKTAAAQRLGLIK